MEASNVIEFDRRKLIQKRIEALDVDLDHQVTLWAELFNNGSPASAEVSKIMDRTASEIMKLERQLY